MRVYRLAWLARQLAIFGPAQHRRQAGAEKLTVQRALATALDIDHRRRTGDQVLQPGARGAGLKLLGFQCADVEHKAVPLPAVQLPDPVQPARRRATVGFEQPHVQAQCHTVAQLLQGHLRSLPISRVQARQPLLDAHRTGQAKAGGQGRIEMQRPLPRPLPPACAQLLLQLVQVARALLQLVLPQAREQRLEQGLQERLGRLW
ncbi:hypothetical protein D3C79_524970 [compost metagenome]